MYFIALFGALMMLISAWMFAKPESWSRAIVRFSEWPSFHLFEILSRLGFGIAFLCFADEVRYPRMMTIIGYILLAVGAGLAMTPRYRHKQFARWSARAFRPWFRPAAITSFLFGALIVHSALWNEAV